MGQKIQRISLEISGNSTNPSFCVTCTSWRLGVTSVPERLPPQDLADDGGPHGLHLAGTRLEDEGVLRLPAAEPDLKAQAAVADVLRHPDLSRLPAGGGRRMRRVGRVQLWVRVGGVLGGVGIE